MPLDDDKLYKGVEMASGLLAARAVGKLSSKAWTKRRASDPPVDPRRDDVPWFQAILWAAAIGAAIGIARLLTRTAVEKGWEKRAARA